MDGTSTKATQATVAAVFGRALSIHFAGQYRLPRSQGGEWGHCDGHAWLSEDALVLLEVERSQTHPEGNVAKVWPWLSENPGKRVLLIHAYAANARALGGSRDRVAAWLGDRMTRSLRGRFWYERRVVEPNKPIKRVTALRGLVRTLKTRGVR